MNQPHPRLLLAAAGVVGTLFISRSLPSKLAAPSPIQFALRHLPFRLDSNESQSRNAPESMAGGIAVFDYNGDGRIDAVTTSLDRR